jgi:ribosomal protein S3
MIDEGIQEVAQKIGHFFIGRVTEDYRTLTRLIRKFAINVELDDAKIVGQAIEKTMVDLRITKIELVNNEVIVTTGRPGLIIGRKGETIDKLTLFLGKHVKIVEAEDNILDYLVPFQPEDLENL